MKLVIDIPERTYEQIKFYAEMGIGTTVDEIVLNGTPLPEHHGRLIDADKLIDSILADRQSFYTQSEMISAVNHAPIILEEASRSI